MKEPKINYEKEIRKCKTIEDVVGKNGLMQKLLKDIMQQLLESEMDEHLGREKYERSDVDDEVNYRNGHSSKLVISSYGEVPIDMLRYVSYKNRKEFMRDLKLVYKADTEEIALAQLDELKDKWNHTYASVIDSWYQNWDKLSTCFAFNKAIRKIIYTTNALEGFNRQLRKFTKIRTVFPSDDSLRKSLYLATDQVMKK